ncbi:glycosyltransferase family 2 protein [Chondrinema litorale]|uniref:glycosyltransferase family 2 protein n=1 Tax=Chondrinema litorale TaxID=2994555 RepID=UPI0025432BD5|nr:glycosyltransferase family 2 protein [Chondrinema litorale]UZR92536.1 glycosyltransferase family 2 protein [Chondrinema litorale]
MTSNTPYFSVVIPVYNREKLIQEAINSVLDQSFSNFEIIVIDDASTDNTAQTIKSYKDGRIIYLRNELNNERGASRNRGILASKGKYICFLDSDDLFDVDHLENFYKYLESKNEPKALLFSNSWLLYDSGKKAQKQVPNISSEDKFAYILKYTFNPARTCVHRGIFNEFLFDPTISGLEDLDLWLHIALKYPVIQLFEYTNIYRLHDESYTYGDTLRYEKELKNFKKIFKKATLKKSLPLDRKNRLLSMCYYHLSAKYELENDILKLYKSIFLSFFLFPPGYNGRTNKILVVRGIYNFPLLGNVVKRIVTSLKN